MMCKMGWLSLMVASMVVGGVVQAAAQSDDNPLTPVPIAEGKVALSPQHVRIEFVGTHVGPKPDPNARRGHFGKFEGTIEMDATTAAPSKITVDIDVRSVSTPQPNLTNHLLTADFFNATEFPLARFESSEIIAGEEKGTATVVGTLSMLGTEHAVEIPITYAVTAEGLTLSGKGTLLRSQHGMSKMLERVNDEVAIEVFVGRGTAGDQQAAPATRRRR